MLTHRRCEATWAGRRDALSVNMPFAASATGAFHSRGVNRPVNKCTCTCRNPARAHAALSGSVYSRFLVGLHLDLGPPSAPIYKRRFLPPVRPIPYSFPPCSTESSSIVVEARQRRASTSMLTLATGAIALGSLRSASQQAGSTWTCRSTGRRAFYAFHMRDPR